MPRKKKENISPEDHNLKPFETIESPIIYSPIDYNIPAGYTGEGVKICLIDSGTPEHKDIAINGESVSFCENSKNLLDKNGHSTMMAGIIGAKNKNSIVGLAPNAQIYFAKAVSDTGQCSFNSIVASILWGIAKQCDIILMPLGTKYDYTILHESIQKACKSGICLIAAAGNDIENGGENYPAIYNEVWSVSFSAKKDDKVDFIFPAKNIITTYLSNKYIKSSGTSISSAFACGITALLIEQKKKENKQVVNKEIYSELMAISKAQKGF